MAGEKKSGIEKVAAFIVDKRKLFYLMYILVLIFSLFSSGWVKVNNDLTDYLDDATETKQGLSVMDREFTTYASAEVMVDNISFERAEALKEDLEKIRGVKEIAFDNTDEHYSDSAAMFSVTFDGTADDEICQTALDSIKERLESYDTYISAELGDSKADTVAEDLKLVMVIVVIVVVAVLLFTSKTYMEVPVLLMTFATAALINMGTNFLFGTISFITNAVSVVLQLALAIDYAIILCHRYTEEREQNEPREAVIQALSKAIPEISGSCLTTVSGLAAMTFMHFKIGYDMGIVMIKAIAISIIVVFTLMPGMILSFSKWIDKTRHKNFVPEINFVGDIVVKLRYVTPVIFVVLTVIAFQLSNHCPYAYSYTNLTTIKQNESQIAAEMIDETFSQSNVLAVLVPRGSYDKEQKLYDKLLAYDEVDSVIGLASIEAVDGYKMGDSLKPRQFAELLDMDIEMVDFLYSAYAVKQKEYGKIVGGIEEYPIPLIDLFDFVYEEMQEGYITLDEDMSESVEELHEKLLDGKKQLLGENYSRLIMKLNIPEESEETFAFLNTARNAAKLYYGDDIYLVGNSTNDRDLSETFGEDNLLISILTVLFVLLVLLFTFQSAGLPMILILVIQGSVWLNFSFPTMQNKPIFFLSYLVVSSIQMGANIDYAIVITNRYTQLRQEMPIEQAIRVTLNQSFPTIFTSGSILAAAGFMIGLLSSDAAVSSIGISLGRGTIISIILVMIILPQLLLLGDKLIDKTSFKVKLPIKNYTGGGSTLINGRIHGSINGRVDGNFYGMVNGDMDINVVSGEVKKEDGEDDEE